jgi:hypothetical protein
MAFFACVIMAVLWFSTPIFCPIDAKAIIEMKYLLDI